MSRLKTVRWYDRNGTSGSDSDQFRHFQSRGLLMNWPHLAIATLVISIAPALALSQSGNGLPSQEPGQAVSLSLQQAIDLALTSNPLVRESGAAVQMADAKLSEARSHRLPILKMNETFVRSNNPIFVFGSLLEQGRFSPGNFSIPSLNNPNPLNNFRTALEFDLPVFDQFQTDSKASQAKVGRSQASLEQLAAKQKIRLDVIKSYFGVVVADARKQMANEAVKSSAAEVKRIRDRFESGLIVQSDLLAVQVQQAEFEQQRIQAEGDIITARAVLNAAMGAAVDTPRDVSSQLSDRAFVVESQPEAIRLALERRPDYNSIALSVRSGKEGERAARGQFLPRVDFFANFGVSGSRLDSGSSDYTVGAKVTFNLFDAGRKARISQALAATSAASALRDRFADQVRVEVVTAYQRFVSARERLAVASKSIEQAEETLRIIRDRYEEGLTTVTEVLRSETTSIRAKFNLIAVRYDYYVSYAELLMATGRLNDVAAFVQ